MRSASQTTSASGRTDGGELELEPSSGGSTDPAWEDDAFFEGRSLSYVYENGKTFSNEFRGDQRFTPTTRRGLLNEVVTIRALSGGRFFVSWVDTNMGHIAQVIDLASRTVHATMIRGPRTDVWRATIQQMPTQPSEG